MIAIDCHCRYEEPIFIGIKPADHSTYAAFRPDGEPLEMQFALSEPTTTRKLKAAAKELAEQLLQTCLGCGGSARGSAAAGPSAAAASNAAVVAAPVVAPLDVAPIAVLPVAALPVAALPVAAVPTQSALVPVGGAGAGSPSLTAEVEAAHREEVVMEVEAYPLGNEAVAVALPDEGAREDASLCTAIAIADDLLEPARAAAIAASAAAISAPAAAIPASAAASSRSGRRTAPVSAGAATAAAASGAAPAAPAPQLLAGMKIEAKWKADCVCKNRLHGCRRFYPAMIERVHEPSGASSAPLYDLHYDDTDREYRVPLANLRVVRDTFRAQASPESRRSQRGMRQLEAENQRLKTENQRLRSERDATQRKRDALQAELDRMRARLGIAAADGGGVDGGGGSGDEGGHAREGCKRGPASAAAPTCFAAGSLLSDPGGPSADDGGLFGWGLEYFEDSDVHALMAVPTSTADASDARAASAAAAGAAGGGWVQRLHEVEGEGEGEEEDGDRAVEGGLRFTADEEELLAAELQLGGWSSARQRRAPDRLSATNDPRPRPPWYRKQVQQQKQQKLQEEAEEEEEEEEEKEKEKEEEEEEEEARL